MLLTDLLRQAPAGSTVVFEDERITYAGLLRRVERRAAGLREWGVRAGDKVAIHMRNRLEWLEIWFATAWLDADLVPLNTRFTDADVRYVLEHSGAQWLVWGPSTPAEHPARVHMLVNGLDIQMTQAMPYADEPLPSAETERAAMVQYTSGSTAFPKGAVLGIAGLVRNGHGLGKAWRMTSDDVVMVVNPLFHCGGSVFAFLAGLTHGASIVLVDRWQVAEGFRLMRAENVTVFPGIEAAVRDLLSHARATGETVPSLRLVSTAADGGLLGAVATTLRTEISNVNGLTESSPNVCVGDLGDPLDVRVERIGRAAQRISDAETQTSPS